MALTLGPRLRALLIVLVLALAALGAGVMVLGRSHSSTGAAPTPPKTPKAGDAGRESATPTPAPSSPSTPTPASPGRPTAPAAAPAVGDQLPTAIAGALAANKVVVVALYDPRAKIDGTALREASAGAQLAGTSFVAIDVTGSQVDALNKRYGVIQDPAVLVLRPPGDLIVRIDGFADRDTVAQAAANAAS